jgi:acyl-CoA hydrolase
VARIGDLVAGLVEDGACLQMGIGAIPGAVLARLKGKRDLGIHTEMFSDGVVELFEAGASGSTNS